MMNTFKYPFVILFMNKNLFIFTIIYPKTNPIITDIKDSFSHLIFKYLFTQIFRDFDISNRVITNNS
jgi:hypothetical protein